MWFSVRPRPYRLAGCVIAALCGAIIWGGLFAILGSMTQLAIEGALAGSAVGAVIGIGFARCQIGPIIPWMSIFAFLGAIIGPGYDADPLSSGLVAGAAGAFLGATGARGFLALIGGLIGLNVGAVGGVAVALFCSAAMAGLGWSAGHSLSKPFSDEEQAAWAEEEKSD